MSKKHQACLHIIVEVPCIGILKSLLSGRSRTAGKISISYSESMNSLDHFLVLQAKLADKSNAECMLSF